jgi:membrane protease YdiL (CAAX protease family)
MKKFAHKHYIICPLVIALLIAIIYVSGLPLALINYKVAGNNIFYILNMILATVLCIILVKALYPEWRFGFQLKGLVDGLLKYGWTGLVGIALILINTYYAFRPFVKTPAIGTFLIWGIIYCFFVAFIEELLLRGVLLNTLLKGLESHKQGSIIAILVSSIFFGLGHIPGMLQYNTGLIIMKFAWTIALGIYFACVYVLSDSLWTVITLHWAVDMSSLIFYYHSNSQNVYANPLEDLIIFYILAAIGLAYFTKRIHLIEHKNNVKLS